MKIEYLIHEYTWSNHCISGNKLGWGITASSMPEDRAYLRELEKLAQAAIVDKTGQVEVEELVYSSVCGFVKMTSIPCESGEDKRQNKRVRMYQPKASDHNPAVYLAPGAEWTEGESIGFLPPLTVEEPEFHTKEILQEMHLDERLPEFMQVVFWCLSGHSEGLNIVVPDWEEAEFAENAQKIMYVIHSLLPQCIREKAGYVSFTREAVPSVSFYFSKKRCGTCSFDLSKESRWRESWDVLDSYFYTGFAEASEGHDAIYQEFQKTAAGYLKNVRDTGNLLKKVEWIFYDIARKHGKSPLDIEYLSRNLPELLYWICKDKELTSVAEDILAEVHQYSFTSQERQSYIESLLGGVTGRSRERILSEVDWMLGQVFEKDKKEFASLLTLIREKNKEIYTCLLCDTIAQKPASDYSQRMYHLNAGDMASLYRYVKDFNEQSVPGERKDDILRTGIGLLNEKLFDQKRYEMFDKIAIHLNRKEQWIKILQDFVSQLQDHASLFDKKQMDTACYIEELLSTYRPETRRILREERGRRGHKARKSGQSKDSGEEDSDMGRRYEDRKRPGDGVESVEENRKGESLHAEVETVEEEPEGPMIPFLLIGFPQGFLTGCIIYLSHYSLMIGHWKIALGMAGMWVLLMLNYEGVILQRKERYPLWKVIGLCLVEGWIIEAAGWFFRSQKVRLYYFIVLGVIAVCIQIINLLRMRKERNQEQG